MSWTENSHYASTGLLMDGTELNLGTSPTSAGTYVAYVDLNPMASGDVIEFRAYVIPLTGETERQVYYSKYVDAQSDVSDNSKTPLKVSVPISIIASAQVRFTLKQTFGTNRTIKWFIDVV